MELFSDWTPTFVILFPNHRDAVKVNFRLLIIQARVLEQLQSLWKMKTGIVCVLAFIALVNGLDGIHAPLNHAIQLRDANPYTRLLRIRSISSLQVCEPGSTKKEDCNHCFCIADGSGWACTEMGCFHSSISNVNSENPVTQLDETNLKQQRAKRGLMILACDRRSHHSFWHGCWYCTCSIDDDAARCNKVPGSPLHSCD